MIIPVQKMIPQDSFLAASNILLQKKFKKALNITDISKSKNTQLLQTIANN